jgi:hypothetical protein
VPVVRDWQRVNRNLTRNYRLSSYNVDGRDNKQLPGPVERDSGDQRPWGCWFTEKDFIPKMSVEGIRVTRISSPQIHFTSWVLGTCKATRIAPTAVSGFRFSGGEGRRSSLLGDFLSSRQLLFSPHVRILEILVSLVLCRRRELHNRGWLELCIV